MKIKNVMRALLLALPLVIFAAAPLFAQPGGVMFHQQIEWSPDGKSLAFTGMRDFDQKTDDFKTDIYIINADGSGLVKILDDTKNEFYADWDRDGKHVVFNADNKADKSSDIFFAKRDGSGLVQLTRAAGKNTAPSVSPDGKRIAFVSTRDGEKYQIYVMDATGANVKRLTNDPKVGFFNPVWSPDGKRLVYYTEKGDRRDQVWVMNADGSNQILLTANTGHNIFPGWSADGKRILFSSSNRETNNSGSFVDGSFLYTMNADGTGVTRLAGNINSFFARFSPDGKKIAFIMGRFPSTHIYVANADGSDPVQITK
jgi:TolB protein